jgi:hypothetical protein
VEAEAAVHDTDQGRKSQHGTHDGHGCGHAGGRTRPDILLKKQIFTRHFFVKKRYSWT